MRSLVSIRVRLENEVRGLLKTFGILFGKRVGGFLRRAEEVIAGDLAVAPELRPIFEALVAARRAPPTEAPHPCEALCCANGTRYRKG